MISPSSLTKERIRDIDSPDRLHHFYEFSFSLFLQYNIAIGYSVYTIVFVCLSVCRRCSSDDFHGQERIDRRGRQYGIIRCLRKMKRSYHSNQFGSYWEYLFYARTTKYRGYLVDHCSSIVHVTIHSYIYLLSAIISRTLSHIALQCLVVSP